MPTYVLLTRVAPAQLETPSDLKGLEKTVNQRVRAECPDVKWIANYAILGSYDYMDVFEAPDAETAAKVALIVRSLGHAYTETWTAFPWERFEKMIPG